MRLGLRFTVRHAENKPAGGPGDGELAESRTKEQPADTQSEEHPIGSDTGGELAGSPAEEQTVAGQAGGGLAASQADTRPADGQAAAEAAEGGDGAAGGVTDGRPADAPAVATEDQSAASQPDGQATGAQAGQGLAAGGAGDRPAAAVAGYQAAWSPAGEPSGAETAGAAFVGTETVGAETADIGTVGAVTAGMETVGAETADIGTVGAETAGIETVGAESAGAGSADAGTVGAETAGIETVGAETSGAESSGTTAAGAETAVVPPDSQAAAPAAARRRWAWLGLAPGVSWLWRHSAGALWQRTVSPFWRRGVSPLWQRSVGRAWQRTIGRLGISRLWRPGPGVREAAAPGARTFALITVLPAILLVAWLVPGLALLLVHQFLPAPMVLISVPLAVSLMILIARETSGRWPVPDTRGAKGRSRAWPAWWGLAGTVAIAAVFAVWQLFENSPQFIVSRDPGAYAQIAYWIADHGRLPIPGSAAAFGGAHPGLSFASFAFTSHAGSVIPGLTAGLPIVLAVGMWAHGVTGAAVISPLIGALGVLAVGGLTARLAGPQWAPAGALLLALTVPEIYTSRSAFSDVLAQVLLFGGLCLVVDSFCARRHIALASLGGLALGLTVLAGTGFLLILLPLIVVSGALLAGRKPQAIPLTAGWLAGVVCGIAGGFGLDLPALSTTTPSLSIIGLLAAGLVVLTALGVGVGLVGPVRRRARKVLAARPLRWLPEAAAALVVLAAIGLAARPYLQRARGPANPYVAALQRLESLPVDPGRLYSESSLYWVVWYLGVPALLLGLIGLAMATRVSVRALITWRDPGGTARAWVLPAAIIGWGLFAVLWLPGTVPDQPWASRRLVPVVLPGLIVLAIWVAAWMIGRAHARGARWLAVSAATACFVIAMGVPPAAITFGIALSRPASPATRLALSGLAFRTTGAGEVRAVEQLCGAIPPHSSVLILDKAAARAFAEVIRGTCDVPTGIVAGGSPVTVNAVIGGITRAGRHPALLATNAAELTPYGVPPREVVNLATQQDEHLLTRPPTATWPVRYTLWMAAPGGGLVGA